MKRRDFESGVRAIVTGGARGIGRAIACRLLEDGYSVVIFDIDRDEGIRAASELEAIGRIDFIDADVGSEESVYRAFQKVHADYGQIDAVVNNAGIAEGFGSPIEHLDIGRWNRVLAVNLTSIALMAKHSYPLFRGSKGAIVNISSTRFLQSEKNTFAYSASKGGVVSLTHSLAVSLGPLIRVNCISPGWIDTKGEPLRPEDHAQHPAGRVGRPQDIASLASYLLSEEAGFITGQNFIVDGGMTRKMIYAE
ncbi:MAG TPA: SDR family oxidoreductase [Deltaproteobacteria bacterium]|jgi:NAD(P)-dependent dehydrogenase (short-subunit alcohol dehydrogenase family)|nr:SDR family oxidoreductase [Deltaproteobacteria bacterium]HQJ08562.1 SDR family oxidoreductase [Deltaproteobacteria bacterium]